MSLAASMIIFVIGALTGGYGVWTYWSIRDDQRINDELIGTDPTASADRAVSDGAK